MLRNYNVKKISALSKPRIYEILKNFEDIAFQDIRKNLKSHIILEQNAFKLFQKAKSHQPLVDIQYSVEEKARMNENNQNNRGREE
ncbi:MAG: hypothetical protein LBU27_00740 [Candidatus Peribacteria bacterium]|jgi:hypothetical protein|nr:hypothetical protein [Candidatus Peribacteria bacterium]